MFPHPCGDELRQRVAIGADPRTVVPDEYFVVKGGTLPIPIDGGVFSGTVGPTIEAAACAVPHGQIRLSQVVAIRNAGGVVVWEPETSKHKTINHQHVNIIEVGPTSFSVLQVNPNPRANRIDGDNLVAGLMQLLLDLRTNLRTEAKTAAKDNPLKKCLFDQTDLIRKRLADLGVTLEDRPGGTTWRVGS